MIMKFMLFISLHFGQDIFLKLFPKTAHREFIIYFMCMHVVCVQILVSGSQRATLQQLGLSFRHVGPRATTQDISLGSKLLCPLNHLHFFKKINPTLSTHHKSKDNPTEKFKYRHKNIFEMQACFNHIETSVSFIHCSCL